jgi:hypothetical protein
MVRSTDRGETPLEHWNVASQVYEGFSLPWSNANAWIGCSEWRWLSSRSCCSFLPNCSIRVNKQGWNCLIISSFDAVGTIIQNHWQGSTQPADQMTRSPSSDSPKVFSGPPENRDWICIRAGMQFPPFLWLNRDVFVERCNIFSIPPSNLASSSWEARTEGERERRVVERSLHRPLKMI